MCSHMECTIVCDCGTELDVGAKSAHPECPSCDAYYAVTLTTIRESELSAKREAGVRE